MPDEAAPEATQDTPTPEPAAPEGTPAESQDSSVETEDWQQRYENLQPEYTRASQEAAQYRQIIELARSGDREAIEWLGFDPVDDGEDDEQEPEYRDPRVDQLLEQQAEMAQERTLDSLESHIDGELDQLAKSAGVNLSDNEIDLVFGALTPGADGNPDVAAAFKKVTGIREAAIADYRTSKKSARPEPGSAGTDKIDLANDDARINAFASMLEAEE